MNNNASMQLVECPRDAMQGWKTFIPTEKKIEYINTLLHVGFHTLDFGSFVSPKAIPQMADTAQVLRGLRLHNTHTKLLAIVANARGAEEAAQYDEISCIGFPFSVSETFQQRNTNSSIGESFKRVEHIREICAQGKKELVIYISMAFGNPYGDPYSENIVFEWVSRLLALDMSVVSLADTVGLASADQVFALTSYLMEHVAGSRIGVHLHSTSANWKAKVDAALRAGCRRFDGALKGIGGCPMANDELVGNMNTEWMIPYFEELHLIEGLNKDALAAAIRLAGEIFV